MNPLKMSILLLLFEAGALLILVSWAMCFSIYCMDMTFQGLLPLCNVPSRKKSSLETNTRTSCMYHEMFSHSCMEQMNSFRIHV